MAGRLAAAPRRRAHAAPWWHALRQQPSEGATLAVCSYGDDFFLVLRPTATDIRVMISDVTAVGDWPIARRGPRPGRRGGAGR